MINDMSTPPQNFVPSQGESVPVAQLVEPPVEARIAVVRFHPGTPKCPDCWQASCPWHDGWWINEPFWPR